MNSTQGTERGSRCDRFDDYMWTSREGERWSKRAFEHLEPIPKVPRLVVATWRILGGLFLIALVASSFKPINLA